MSEDRICRMIELARAHVEAGGMSSAGVYYRMILKDTSPPKTGVERIAHGEACLWYARKSLAEGRIGTATDWYRQALAADPRAVDYRVEYCRKALIPMGMLKNARIEAETATKIDPQSKDAWSILGGMEQALGNIHASITAYDNQLELDPTNPIARLDRATIALDTADYEMVWEMCKPIRGKHLGDALHCMAMAAYRQGQHEKAIELYDQAIEIGCFDPELATWNKSLAMHSIGRYLEGWKAHEARGRQKTDGALALSMNRFTKPMWKGEPPPATIHLHQEMGHGDCIAMARYVPVLLARGYKVHLEVAEPLVSLMVRSFPDALVMPKAIDYPGALGIPQFDYHVPMLSLPAVMGTDIDTVPWSGAYFKPDPDKVTKYQSVLYPQVRTIGLCWSSGIRTEGLWLSEYGRRKSMMFNTLRPVFGNPDAAFVSLQVGPERRECRQPVSDLLPIAPNWEDTTALVACLDLVITVDTSVAHLAGALGKPTWVMMHTEGSWHWMAPRPGAAWNKRSPWYPSVKLYRQEAPHQWTEVVRRIADDLIATHKRSERSVTSTT